MRKDEKEYPTIRLAAVKQNEDYLPDKELVEWSSVSSIRYQKCIRSYYRYGFRIVSSKLMRILL